MQYHILINLAWHCDNQYKEEYLDERDAVVAWCNANIGTIDVDWQGHWVGAKTISWVDMKFLNQSDATWFNLVWGLGRINEEI